MPKESSIILKRANNLPIGVFDSGIGGLTVLKELVAAFPNERFLYFGDTARVPYGTKSESTVLAYSKEITGFLLAQRVKMIVAACNTASALAVPHLKKNSPVPLLGVVEATAQMAAALAPRGAIGVLATRSTIASSVYTRELKQRAPQAKVIAQACPLLVPLVEEGWFNHPITRQVVEIYLKKMVRTKPDAVILGCTHYPMLQKIIQKIFGARTILVDSPKAVAQVVRCELLKTGQAKPAKRPKALVKFFVTDDPQSFKRHTRLFMGQAILGPVQIVHFD